MSNIKILDCTLRDGGFINDWKFGNDTIRSIFQRLSSARIDLIEVGFIDERREFDIDRTITPNTWSLKKIFEDCHSNSTVVGMVDYGTCSLDNIEECQDSFLDGIRVIFKKKDRVEAIAFCSQLKKKGYDVFVQPVSITGYTETEMLELISMVNELNPYAMSIVDTYGLLHKENLLSYFNLMDNNLNKEIGIGYHSHNNFQLAYANSIELISSIANRTLVIDSSVYGMGKNAGNANTELIANYLNMRNQKEYDINQILEIIDTDIMRIFRTSSWGYSLKQYLAAIHDCHPKYVDFLVEKKTLSIEAINYLLGDIPVDTKLTYNQKLIENAYLLYQKYNINDEYTNIHLKDTLSNRKILLLGPGLSLKTQSEKINHFITENNPIVISANCFLTDIKTDYIFISNAKRYSQLIGKIVLAQKKGVCPSIIATTNITAIDGQVNYWLNYSSLLGDEESTIRDSAMVMLLHLFASLGIQEVDLAGFDGFSSENNYFDMYYEFSNTDIKADFINRETDAVLNTFKDKIKLTFITESKYSKELIR